MAEKNPQKADMPVSQMFWASQMRRASPQTAYEERDTLTPYWPSKGQLD